MSKTKSNIRYKDAVSKKYVTKEYAAAHPDKIIKEQDKVTKKK